MIETTNAERTHAGRIPFFVTVAFRCVPSRLCVCYVTRVIALADAQPPPPFFVEVLQFSRVSARASE